VREQGDDVIQVSTNAIGREALCPEGKVPLGGGGAAGAITDQASSNGLTNVQRSLPTGSQDGWSVLFGKRDGTNWAIGERIQWFVQVTCIAALP
jgi:hypothetical protein